MSFSGQPPIVFDQYQRYHFIESAVRLLSRGKNVKILEIGGAFSALPQLLPDHPLVILDQVFESPVNVRADSLKLPFQDASFEIVVSTDVLEHIPPENRLRFLAELERVTSGVLILGFPQKSALARSADLAFKEYIRAVTGSDFRFLSEHLEYGLPDPETIRGCLSENMSEILQFENSSIDSWLLLQIANLAASRRSEFEQASRLLNEFFNEYYESFSHIPPCYRVFIIAGKGNAYLPLPQKLGDWTSTNPAVKYAEKAAVLASAFTGALDKKNAELVQAGEFLAAAQLAGERTEIARQQLAAEFESLKRKVAELQIALQNKEDELKIKSSQLISYSLRNRNLQDYLNLFLNHPVYKGYKLLKRFGGRNANEREAGDYEKFQMAFEPSAERLKKQTQDSRKWKNGPSFTIVTPVYSPGLDIFEKTIESVRSQSYENWTWEVADASADDEAWYLLKQAQAIDPRIHPIRLAQNLGIAENTNAALRLATGDYIVMLDHDDMLAPQSLFAVAETIRKHPNAEFIYSDCDKLDELGRRCDALFKPDWSPHAMLSFNLLNQLSVFRRSWLDSVGYLDPSMDGAQDWDLYLRITEKTQEIYHVPQILYHWRQSAGSTAQNLENKPYARTAQIAALTAHLKRKGINSPCVEFKMDHPVWSTHPVIKWQPARDRTISIIIPSRDQSAVLGRCLHTLFEQTSSTLFEVIIVDTGSTEPETERLYQYYQSNKRVHLVRQPAPFNFGRACNFGASHSSRDLLLFLNNDTEILQKDWLELLSQWFELKDIGIVGAKLLYPNGKLQHAGVILGMGGLASHLFIKEEENIGTLFGTDGWYRDISAVTGACLMISRDIFNKVEGFDEEFTLLYSDVDLCLKVREAGYGVVYTPHVRLIHHESLSHKGRAPRSDFERASLRWRKWLQDGDPFFNPNLSYASSRPVFHRSLSDTPKNLNEGLMKRMPKKEIITLPDDLE